MVPAPTYKNLPVFGESASLVVPIPETYLGGFLPGQVFPAEYENWLMNYITDNSLTSQTTATSLAAEVVTILTAASISPIPASTGQLYEALNALYATVGALASEASTRAAADTTLQAQINTGNTVFTGETSTSGGTINVGAVGIGESRYHSYRWSNNTGSSQAFSIRTPTATGSYLINVTTVLSDGSATAFSGTQSQNAQIASGTIPNFVSGFTNVFVKRIS